MLPAQQLWQKRTSSVRHCDHCSREACRPHLCISWQGITPRIRQSGMKSNSSGRELSPEPEGKDDADINSSASILGGIKSFILQAK